MELAILNFAAACFVPFIFFFKRELLLKAETFELIVIVSAVLFLAGMVLIPTRLNQSFMAGGLMSPLVAAGLFWGMLKLFRRRYKRDPKDTYLNWKPGMAPDRLFNVIYFTFAFVSAVVVPTAIHALAKSLLIAIGFQA